MPLNKSTTIKRTDSIDLDFPQMVTLLNQELRERYDTRQLVYDTYNPIYNLETVVVAYRNDIPAGCGCFEKFGNDTIEIKRIFVKPTERRLGIAFSMLSELEIWAKEDGYSHVVLATGTQQPESIALFKKAGYTRIPNYGQYIGMEGSVCMEKEL